MSVIGRADRSSRSDGGVVNRSKSRGWILLLALSVALTGAGGCAQGARRAPGVAKPAESPPGQVAASAPAPVLEPKAIDILKAASSRLAAAHSMTFTAVMSYESPSRLGPPLVYATKSEVTVQRPDKLRVITPGDGPASEFYYDGKTMVAFAPAENFAATAEAPPTIDAALKAAYDKAAIYFPFTDLIIADPYEEFSDGLQHAFYIGQSHVVGGTTTDIVAIANGWVFEQIWIGTEDKLPRMVRAVFHADPQQLRHEVEFSNWRLNPTVAAGAFKSSKAAAAKRIQFSRPDLPALPQGVEPPTKTKASKPN